MLDDGNIPSPLKLLNEWRDTAFTVTAAVVTAYCVLSTGDPKLVSYFFEVMGYKEFVSSALWYFKPPPQIDGAPKNPDNVQVAFARFAGRCAFRACEAVIAVNLPVLAWAAGFGFVVVLLAGGPAAVVEAYRRTWDWPRKRGGPGGPSETSKLKTLPGKIAGALLPAPARPASAAAGSPALVPVTS